MSLALAQDRSTPIPEPPSLASQVLSTITAFLFTRPDLPMARSDTKERRIATCFPDSRGYIG